MKIQLIKNTGLTLKNKIQHNGDIKPLEDYLATLGYDPDFLTQKERTGKTLTQLTFSETFINGNDNFNIEDIANYDYAVVENYNYLPNIKSFWVITAKRLDSSKNWTIKFEIDLVATFGTSKLNLDNPLSISRKHINIFNEFESYGDKKIKENSILKHRQPSNDFEIKSKAYKDIFYNDLEEKFKNELGIEYWGIYTYSAKDSETVIANNTWLKGSILNAEGKVEYTDEVKITNADAELLTPFKTGGGKISVNNLGSTAELYSWDSSENFKKLIKNPKIKSFKIIDFLPINTITIKNGSIYSKEDVDGIYYSSLQIVDTNDNLINPKPEDIVGFETLAGYSKEILKQEYKPKENILFDFEYADTYFSDDDINNLWTSNQQIEIQFSPFKEFEIGYEIESPYSNNVFSNNDLDILPTKDKPLFNRIYTFSSTSNTFVNELINKTNGATIEKTTRSSEVPLLTDKWEEFNLQKKNRIAQQFGLPAASAGAGFVVGGPVGAAVGLGLSTGGTILKNQKLKNTPATVNNANTDFRSDSISTGINSKRLYIHQPDEKTKNSLAFEFHKFGLFHFYMSDKYNLNNLLPKYRFNYLELSPNATTENTKDLDLSYAKKYIEQLQNGIVFWNYESDSQRKYILDYNYKNPDKEGIMENINTLNLELKTGYNYRLEIDNTSGKYNKGINLTVGIAIGNANLYKPESLTIIASASQPHLFSNIDLNNADDIRAGFVTSGSKFRVDADNIKNANSQLRLMGTFDPDDFIITETPATKKKEKELLKLTKKEALKEAKAKGKNPKKHLTPEQKKALDERTKLARDKAKEQAKNENNN